MNDEERLAYHVAESKSAMDDLEDWFNAQFKEKLVEPNSGLGQAIEHMRKRWTALTLSLHKSGMLLTNNLVERFLKRAIVHRNNALFFRSLEGARIGDAYMSLIHTAELCGADPFDYLVALMQHAKAVADAPADWVPVPWSYTDAPCEYGHNGHRSTSDATVLGHASSKKRGCVVITTRRCLCPRRTWIAYDPRVRRRGFLILCSTSTAELWVPGRAPRRIPPEMILMIGGACSFCALPAADAGGVAGVVGTTSRICGECVDLSKDVVELEDEVCDGLARGLWDVIDGAAIARNAAERERTAPGGRGVPVFQLDADIFDGVERGDFPKVFEARLMDAGLSLEQFLQGRVRVIGKPRATVRPNKEAKVPIKSEDFSPSLDLDETTLTCSFCEGVRSDADKLIRGQAAAICDHCVGSAARLFEAALLMNARKSEESSDVQQDDD
jgi:hypothetical protein